MKELWSRILFAGARGKHSVLPSGLAEAERSEGSSCAVGAPALDADEHPGVAAPAGKALHGRALRVVPFKGVARPPAKRVAVLFDTENLGGCYAHAALDLARSEGEVVVAKAYGPQSVLEGESWAPVIQSEGLDAHVCTGCVKHKNSVDMHLAIDGVRMILQLGIDALCVVSNDSDYAPLAASARQQGVRYHGMGTVAPGSSYSVRCDDWTDLSHLGSYAPDCLDRATLRMIERASSESGIEEAVLITLAECLQAIGQKGGWVFMSALGAEVRRMRPDFSPKASGYSNLTKLLEGANIFEFKPAKTSFMVRLKAA